MAKKRAFVRYSKQGKIVPGSLILTSGSYPNGPSTWNEIPADLCCNSGLFIENIPVDGVFPIGNPGITLSCSGATPPNPAILLSVNSQNAANISEIVAGFNAQFPYVGKFSVDGGTDMKVEFSAAFISAFFPGCTSILSSDILDV